MLRALLVDGGGSYQLNLREQLAGLDVHVVGEAVGMAEAEALLGAIRYDLVVATLWLPDGSGLDLARRMADGGPASLGEQAPPAVVLIGDNKLSASAALAAGAAAYLVRPVQPIELTEAVVRALAERAQTRAEVAAGSAPGASAVALEYGETPAREGPGLLAPESSSLLSIRRLPVTVGEKTLLLDPAEIFYAYALSEQVYLKLAHQRIRCGYTLRDLEQRLAPFGFVRTHRRYLANLGRVREVLKYFKGALGLVMADGERSEVPVSRNLSQSVRGRLGL